MYASEATPAGAHRLHLVLVPGFGGFDALGQLEYYAGTSVAFRQWLDGQAPDASAFGSRVCLHYFPNLPTAGVRTRARLLGRYLSKRVRRNEIQAGDRIALIGHSTGGLDIRQLLLDLAAIGATPYPVNGGEDRMHGATSGARELLDRIDRVAFLSVPQRGTNIANWVKEHAVARHFLLGLLRAGIDGLDLPVVDLATSQAGVLLNRARGLSAAQHIGERLPDLLLAIADANAEAATRNSADPLEAAEGRAALYDLNLWLSHTNGDFFAIDDLACDPVPPRGIGQLTHAASQWVRRAYHEARMEWSAMRRDQANLTRCSEEERRAEVDLWDREGIRTRSYATRAPAPFDRPKAVDRLYTFPEVVGKAAAPVEGTDITYRVVFGACAAGPFAHCMVEDAATAFESGARLRVEAWENDGIVNTGSMLWPNGSDTLLVNGDHGDIIGHYRLDPSDTPTGRRYDAYDVFESGAGFDEARFHAVWSDVFDFCAGSNGR